MAAFSLRQLEIFVTVAERETLAAAGRVLRLSQATMSEALKSLEAGLRQPLFDRVHRRLRLNAAGQAFLRDARLLLDRSDALYRNHVGRPRLTCGASVTLGNYILPNTLIDIARHHPDLHIELVIRNTADIIQMLLDREIQAALVEGRVAHTELEAFIWREDELVFIAPPDHRMAEANTPGELAAMPWILREAGSGTRESFDVMAASWPRPPRVRMTVGGNEMLKQAVQAGLGLGCLSYAAVEAEVRRGDLALVATGRHMVRTLTFVRRRDFIEEASLDILTEALGLAIARSTS